MTTRRSFLGAIVAAAMGICASGIAAPRFEWKPVRKPYRCVWTGEHSQDFSDPLNWEGGVVPKDGDDVWLYESAKRPLELQNGLALNSLYVVGGVVGWHQPNWLVVGSTNTVSLLALLNYENVGGS